MSLPDDKTLVDEEISIGGEKPDSAIIACGALAREIIAVLEANNLRGKITLECLPALLHNRPDKIAEAVQAKAKSLRARGVATVHVAYADCGTGGHLDKVCEAENLERIRGPHCYAFFSGNDAFQERAETDDLRSFYLTDFLARQFDSVIWRGLGLDRHPELLEMYFGSYETLVYLAQTEDPALDEAASKAAERMGLTYERRFTGYGELNDFITKAAS